MFQLRPLLSGVLYRGGILLALGSVAVAAHAQSRTTDSGSLIADPQRGAAPAPLQTRAPPPSTPQLTPPITAPSANPRPLSVDPVRLQPISGRPPVAVEVEARDAPRAQSRPGGLPAPSGDPMAVDAEHDPLLVNRPAILTPFGADGLSKLTP